MWNGFYKLNFKTKRELVKFFKEAIGLAYSINIDCKEGNTMARTLDHNTSINDYLSKYLSLSAHNVCINRQIYNDYHYDQEGEIGSSTFGNVSKFIFIYLNIDNLNMLIEKYKLEKL
jgi:hypothetical protein